MPVCESSGLFCRQHGQYDEPSQRGTSGMTTFLTLVLIVVSATWGAMALWFKSPAAGRARWALPALWAALSATMLVGFLGGHLWCLWLYAGMLGLLLLWWFCLVRPQNDRAWMPEVSRQTYGSAVDGMVRLHNVRDFRWVSSEEFDPRWVSRDYDLSRLASVDLILSYWGRPAVAHAMVSFGFEGGEYALFSVEIRRKRGDKFSEIGGFFRQYELAVLASTEEDSLKVRTNVRGEDGYLYRVVMDQAAASALFLAYVDTANSLIKKPRFYNTITANCTTLVYQLADRIVPGLPLDYRVLLSGYLPEYLFALGALAGASSPTEYRSKGRYTDRARESQDEGSFSHDIRRGVPGVVGKAS